MNSRKNDIKINVYVDNNLNEKIRKEQLKMSGERNRIVPITELIKESLIFYLNEKEKINKNNINEFSKSDSDCPHGLTFGVDCDDKEECETCEEETWAKCAQTQTDILRVRKNNIQTKKEDKYNILSTKASLINNLISIKFGYLINDEFDKKIKIMRTLPNSYFCRFNKSWKCPISLKALNILKENNIEIDQDLQNLYKKLQEKYTQLLCFGDAKEKLGITFLDFKSLIKDGYIKEYKYENRKMYKNNEIDDFLKKIELLDMKKIQNAIILKILLKRIHADKFIKGEEVRRKLKINNEQYTNLVLKNNNIEKYRYGRNNCISFFSKKDIEKLKEELDLNKNKFEFELSNIINEKKAKKNKIKIRNDEILNIKEVCEILKVNNGSIYKLINNGKLKHFKFGNRYRIRKSDVYSLFDK